MEGISLVCPRGWGGFYLNAMLWMFTRCIICFMCSVQIERVRRRRYRLRESALEVFLRRGKSRSLFVDFGSDPRDHGRRNDFIRALEAKVRKC